VSMMVALVVIPELAVININCHWLLVIVAAGVEDELGPGVGALVVTFQGLPFRRARSNADLALSNDVFGRDLIQKCRDGTVGRLFNIFDEPAEAKVILVMAHILEFLSDVDRLVCLYFTKRASTVVSTEDKYNS
jgi:hypothetical protein